MLMIKRWRSYHLLREMVKDLIAGVNDILI